MKKRLSFAVMAMLLFSLALIVSHACTKDSEDDNDKPEENQAPTVNITAPANGVEIIKGSTVTVNATANDPDGSVSITRFRVDGSERGTDDTPPYSFNWNTANDIEGNHTLRVLAYDEQSSYGYDEINVMIKDTTSDPAPIAAFTADVTSGEPHLTVQFTDQSQNDPILWSWDFGDYGSSTEQNPTHTYDEEGIYTVSLEVRNNYGQDTETKTGYITIAIVVTPGTFTDPRDGQTYNTITLGGQTWFAQNLNYEAEDSWWYDFSPQYGGEYGRLYLWEAALTACPPGWHLPSDEEYAEFEMYIGMSPGIVGYTGFRGTPAGKFMKSTEGWFDNGNGDNHSGFNGLPGGSRFEEWNFDYVLEEGRWWTSTPAPTDAAWIRRLKYNHDGAGRYAMMQRFAASIRCLKD